jgi:hypothetical protein
VKLNAAIVEHLLAFQPFRRFVLVTVRGQEYVVNSPKDYRVLGEVDTLFWTEDGTADFLDLKLVEQIRMDDDFGFAEFKQMWK